MDNNNNNNNTTGAAHFTDVRRRERKLKMPLRLAYLWVLVVSLSCAAGRLPASKQKLKVDKYLKRFNKLPIKTIKSPDGDLIDCVHISHQPAFDHPFLKDHKIQMRPSYHPEEVSHDDEERKMYSSNEERRTYSITEQKWRVNGRENCPENTIPIRRTKKEDVLRASSLKRYGKKKPRSFAKPDDQSYAQGKTSSTDSNNQNTHQHAVAYVGGKYYGAKATINVWEPKIQHPNEFSSSQIWVLGGTIPNGPTNSIEAGWQVNPALYGDNNTRLFTYWTGDGYQATGCYNLLCSGFIQINPNIAVGASISPLSVFQESQFDITILIWKDPKQGDWWLQFGNDYVMGYWPSTLFSYLKDGASSMIQFGGEVVDSGLGGQHTSTQMGSGYFPEGDFGKASYFKSIQIVDSSNNLKSPKVLEPFSEQSNCYDISAGHNKDWGHFFYYGGPGQNYDCP
ncbi:hypothetical protein OROMI_015545 [Orobanche minor]